MSALEALKGERVHTRSIRIETFAVDDDRVIVEGTLEDTRAGVINTISGLRREPGMAHGMVVRFLVGGMPVKILDVEVEMRQVPLEECPQAASSVKRLIGMHIVYGYSKAVKEHLGGAKGCTHLTNLILSMGSAAIQGMAALRGREPIPPDARAMMIQYVKNSCMVWREGGPQIQKAMQEVKKASESKPQKTAPD